MVKKRTQLIKQAPIKMIETRKTRHSRKLSAQEIKENSPRPKPLEKLPNSQKDLPSHEERHKALLSNQDIDIYFASCISQTFSNKPNSMQENERSLQNISIFNNQKSILMQEIKEQHIQSNQKCQEPSFQQIQEEKEENQDQDSQYGNQSPIFGRKMSKNDANTPSYKLDELKIYQQSEQIPGRDLMDQLQDGSKVSFLSQKQSISHQVSSENSVHRFGSRIQKNRKKSQSFKKKTLNTFLPLDETQIKWNSSHSLQKASQIRRRAQMLRLTCLTENRKTYENSLEVLKKTSNLLKNVMYYYEVREYQQKVYSFRSNVFQVLNDEIRKMKNTLVMKKYVCNEAIQKKMKNDHYSMWESQQEKRKVF